MSNALQILSTSTPSRQPNPLLEQIVEELFDEMLLTFGKKFVDQWAVNDTVKLRDHWVDKLTGFKPSEIKRGRGALEALEWPPTLNQFRNMCRPPIDNLSAYHEAIAGLEVRNRGDIGRWTSPAIFWAAMSMRHDLGSQTYAQVKGKWENVLAEQIDRGTWAEIPMPVPVLPAPGKSESSRSSAAAVLEQIGASGLLKTRNEDTAWYRKILADIKAGRVVSMIQRQFAEQAAAAHGYRN
jgi:hypothetical protein